jgi:hypothetical protein
MKGYRTVVTNVVIPLASALAVVGVEIPPEMVEELIAGGFALYGLVNIGLRFITDSKVGES